MTTDSKIQQGLAETSMTPVAGNRPNEHAAKRRRRRNYFQDDDICDIVNYPQYSPLGYLAEARLIQQAQAGDLNARNLVWSSNIRLVYSAVNQFHVPKALLADALQEGVLSLRRAIERFDVARYNAFSTYAWHWISQGIRRFLSHQRFGQRIPCHLYSDFIQLIRKLDSLPSQQDRSRYLAENDDFHPKHMKTLRRLTALVFTSSLDEMQVPEKSGIQSTETEVDLDLSGLGQQLLATLTERERTVLSYRYGLLGSPEETLEEVGHRLEITRERVRQIQVSAEERLKRKWQKLRHLIHLDEADTEEAVLTEVEPCRIDEVSDTSTEPLADSTV